MTVTIGWWAIPAIITILAVVLPFLPEKDTRSYGIGTGIVGMFQLVIGVIISLVAWLVWALV